MHLTRLLLPLVMLPGCGAPLMPLGAPLAVPPADAPAAERLAAYDRLRPVEFRSPVADRYQSDEPGAPTALTDSHVPELLLASGRQISDPRLLLSAVGPESSTAQHILRVEDAVASLEIASYSSWGFLGLGLAGAAVGLTDAFGDSSAAVAGGAIATGLVGMAIAGYSALGISKDMHDELASSYAAYERDLRARLDVCRNGQVVEPCPAPLARGEAVQ